MAKWPYNTKGWARLREQKLEASPWCDPCTRRGKLKPANTVDHIVSIAKGGPAFPPLSGLMSMCASCHSVKTSAVDRAGGNGVAFKGCDASGFPIDEKHPAYGGKRDTPSKDERLRPRDHFGASVSTKFRGRSWG